MTTELFEQPTCSGNASELAAASAKAPNFDGPGIACEDTAAVFNSWGNELTSLAMWCRQPPADISSYLDELQLDRMTGWRKSFDAQIAGSVIAEAMADSEFAQPELTSFLATDMVRLTRIFATTTGTGQIEARLDVIRNDACRRYHVDSYPERLAVTYVGPGTVAVPRCHGEHARIEQENYAGPVIEIPPFWVSLFAGEQPGRPGLVHRSPKIKGTQHVRLFFCVNAAPS